jgi:glyoxylase-like metal-dependent hydrolase (beta-lactamase superfamily II)
MANALELHAMTSTPLPQQPGWRVGDVTITPILEVTWTLTENWLFPDGTPERLAAIDWLRPHYLTDNHEVMLLIQAFVIESAGMKVIVDTCIGNDKPRSVEGFNHMQTPWLKTLSDAGFDPASMDAVVCTHLHFDHIGWNTRLDNGRWVPTFPNARYLIGDREWAHYEPKTYPHLDDSVRPIFDAGLADLIAPGHRITDEVSVEPTPGHTPGHACVHIRSQGAHAVITGDMIHHPSQCAHPEWRTKVDFDPEQGCETRRRFLCDVADSPTLVIGTHFAVPSAGHIRSDGDAWRFVPHHPTR